jgi:hypothetical protein
MLQAMRRPPRSSRTALLFAAAHLAACAHAEPAMRTEPAPGGVLTLE